MNKKQLSSKREIISASPIRAGKEQASFPDEFKRNAPERLLAAEQSGIDLAIELEIRRNQLCKWAKKLDEQAHVRHFARLADLSSRT